MPRPRILISCGSTTLSPHAEHDVMLEWPFHNWRMQVFYIHIFNVTQDETTKQRCTYESSSFTVIEKSLHTSARAVVVVLWYTADQSGNKRILPPTRESKPSRYMTFACNRHCCVLLTLVWCSHPCVPSIVDLKKKKDKRRDQFLEYYEHTFFIVCCLNVLLISSTTRSISSERLPRSIPSFVGRKSRIINKRSCLPSTMCPSVEVGLESRRWGDTDRLRRWRSRGEREREREHEREVFEQEDIPKCVKNMWTVAL